MAKALYLDCFSGISGDMFLGALIDLGVPLSEVEAALGKLQLPDHLHLHADRKLRSAVSGIKFDVHTHSHGHSHNHGHGRDGDHSHDHSHGHQGHSHDEEHHHHHHGRSHADIQSLIEKSSLDPWIKKRASSLFRRIAVVEAGIHGQSVENVHFHEVGALDSIADIIGACAALHYLGIDQIHASHLVEGTGTLKCDHGSFPIPSPATLGLLQNSGAKISQLDLPYELITPTGAALLAEFVTTFGPLAHFEIKKIGWGLGTRDIPGRPNALRVLLGEKSTTPSTFETDTVAVLETNLDDCSGESLGYLSEILLKAGAYDVAYSPITMKKSRPAWQLQVIAAVSLKTALAEIILRQSSAFGLRVSEVDRIKLSREIKTVTTSYGEVRVKVGSIGSDVIKSVPEYEDCRRLALEHNVPLETVFQAALKS